MKEIHDNIRTIRSLKDYSQKYMAESLGISQSSYGKLERGHTQITWNKLNKLAAILSMSVWNIIHFDDDKSLHPGSGEEEPAKSGVLLTEFSVLKERIAHLQKLNNLLKQQLNDKIEIIRLLKKNS